jgi:hypothetical protein
MKLSCPPIISNSNYYPIQNNAKIKMRAQTNLSTYSLSTPSYNSKPYRTYLNHPKQKQSL